MKAIFADMSFFLATFNPEGELHEPAIALLNLEAVEKRSAPDSVCVTEYVFRRSRRDVAGNDREIRRQIRRAQNGVRSVGNTRPAEDNTGLRINANIGEPKFRVRIERTGAGAE